VYSTGTFLFNGPPLLTSVLERARSRAYAAELICSNGVLGFQTFKLPLCIYNKLRSRAESLGY